MGISQPRRIYPTPASLPRGQKARKLSLPPPIGGWNTRDDPVQMGPTDATHLVNFYPEINQVAVRRGYTSHATGVGAGNVDTVVEFFSGSTRRLIAASPTNIYNATSAGAAVSLASGFSNGRWQTAMMNGVMGFVNGADAPRTYNGTTLGTMTVSGPTVANLIGINVFKSRSYFWENNSQSFWYSATNALGGVLTEFALGEIASKGGKLLAMTNWTVDGGSGTDDFAVFVMSTGETIVYQGSDPGSSSAWSLVGIYVLPVPMDIRGFTKIGSEVLIVTDSDIAFVPSSFDKPSPTPSKLKGALEISGPAYRNNTGWQSVYHSKRSMLILNIPISATQFEQYVINMSTGAPARFTNMNARSWGVYNSDIYFGGIDGVVYQADIGTDDNGSNIDCDARQAWSDLGSSDIKQVNSFRVVFAGTSGFSAGAEIGYDFKNAMPTRVVTSGGTGAPWGSPWSTPWGSTTQIIDGWKLAAGSGQVLSTQVSIGVQGERPTWYRTDFMVSAGFSL